MGSCGDSAFEPAPRFSVSDLEVKATGSLAWIESFPGPSYEVHEFAASTGNLLLDSGPAIEPNSLAVSTSRVHWTRPGAPFSAPLI
jgi:hypothetical protein